MTPLPSLEPSPANRQSGLLSVINLPDDGWIDRWERIFCDPELKRRLLNAVLFGLVQRPQASRVGLPVHRLVVLSGPPGTGKTTLAKGLADKAARELVARGIAPGVRFAEIDPHALPSELLGQSQRGVARLFDRVLPDLAADGNPLIVLLDEVETLAVDRLRVSADTNPVDVQRATDAVLTGLDLVAANHPNVLFLATTNLVGTVDAALLSRSDLVEELGLPSAEAVAQILQDTLGELDRVDPAAYDPTVLLPLAERCVAGGLDARQVRKSLLRTIFCADAELALGIRPLTVTDLERTAEPADVR
ncbi:MAG: AAA family ATPase [Mycobacteriales bacterium]